MINRRKIGNRYENRAVHYLKKQGFFVIAQNVYTKKGEIDIIAKEQEYLCFIEVKYRSSGDCGTPGDAVTKKKQKKIYEAAKLYLYYHHTPFDTPCRFDVIEILGEQIHLLRNAYGGL